MNKLTILAAAAMCTANALAMPTKAELTKAQKLVAELMAPETAEFNAAGKKEKPAAALKVAEASSAFAKAAETEAARFLLYKGAVSYYVRGGEYEKAADALAALQASVKAVPAEVVIEIAGKATGKISKIKAPKLFAIYRSAKQRMSAAEEAKTLAAKLKKTPTQALQRRYAEALAVSGNWKQAYVEFGKMQSAPIREAVAAEAAGKAKNVAAGEFWWEYEPVMEDVEDFFKAHAAVFYRRALVAGEITGLKKNLIERRIADFAADEMEEPAGTVVGVKSQPGEGTEDAEPAKKIDTEGKTPETRIGKYTWKNSVWSYRVENGEATIEEFKDGKFVCAVSPTPSGDLKIPVSIDGVKVTHIGTHAFIGSDINSVMIPEGMTTIGHGAFAGIGGLRSVSIPSTVTNIGSVVFIASGEMESFDVAQNNRHYSSRNGMLCSKDGSVLFSGVNGKVTIPDGVTTISGNAFQRCCQLESVTIPSSVSTIGSQSFFSCTGLSSVKMLGEQPDARPDAFAGCAKLKEIHVPASAKSWANMKEWCGKPLVFDKR